MMGKHVDGRSKQCGGVREPGGSSMLRVEKLRHENDYISYVVM